MRRMDRYNEQDTTHRISRTTQNQELYENIGTNTKYTSFTDVTNANAIDISSTRNSNTREGYRQMKEYQDVVPIPRVKKELEEFKNIYHDCENRIYDINSALEEARKNRLDKDELEEKRKLKNQSYNILTSLNAEELEKYRQEKREKAHHPNDEELRELIDTITSATLAGDIKAASSLLSDLMATSIMDKVDKPIPDEPKEDKSEKAEQSEKTSPTLLEEKLDLDKLQKITKEEANNTENTSELAGADQDFYTRSMDLSNQDFELDDELKEKTLPLGVKILIFLVILIILGAVFYFVWQHI